MLFGAWAMFFPSFIFLILCVELFVPCTLNTVQRGVKCLYLIIHTPVPSGCAFCNIVYEIRVLTLTHNLTKQDC